jgi:hypothetical protein
MAGRGHRLPEAGPIVGALQGQECIALGEAGRGGPVAVGQIRSTTSGASDSSRNARTIRRCCTTCWKSMGRVPESSAVGGAGRLRREPIGDQPLSSRADVWPQIAARGHRGRVMHGTPVTCSAALLVPPAARILAASSVASKDRGYGDKDGWR